MASKSQREPDMDASQRTKGRSWRRVVYWLLIPPLSIILALAAVPLFYSADDVNKKVTELLSDALDVPVKIGPVEYSLLTGGSVKEIEVGSPDGFSNPLLQVAEIRIGYDFSNLLRRKLKLKEFVVESPKLTIEVKDGVSNLQSILMSLAAKAEQKKDKAPKRVSERKQLSPLDVDFSNLAIEQASLRVVDETRSFDLKPISFRIDGSADSDALNASIRILMEKGLLKTSFGKETIRSSLKAGCELDWTTQLFMSADQKIRLKNASTEIKVALSEIDLRYEDTVNSRVIDVKDTELAFHSRARLPSDTDSFFLDEFQLTQNESKLVDATLNLQGIRAFVKAGLKSPLPNSIKNLYFEQRDQLPALLRVTAEKSLVHLSEFEPFVRALSPDAKMRGKINMDELLVAVDESAIRELSPKQLLGSLSFKELSLVVPSKEIEINNLNGTMRIGTQETLDEESKVPFEVQAKATSLRAKKLQISTPDLRLTGHLEGADFSAPGPIDVNLSAGAKRLTHAGFGVDNVRFSADFTSPKLVSQDPSEKLAPSKLTAELNIPAAQTKTGTATIAVKDIRSVFKSTIPAIFPPRGDNISWVFDSGIKSIRQSNGFIAKEAQIDIKGSLQDPRFQPLISPTLSSRMKIASISNTRIQLKDFGIKTKLGLRDWGVLAATESPLPNSVTASVSGSARQIFYAHSEHGRFQTAANFSMRANLAPKTEKVRIINSKIKIEDLFAAALKGQVTGLLTNRKRADLAYSFEFADLSKLPKKLTPELRKKVRDVSASGKVSLEGRATGRIPNPNELSIDRLPLKIRANMALDKVSLSLPTAQFGINDCNGDMRAEFSKDKAHVDFSARTHNISKELQGERLDLNGIKMISRLGVEDNLLFLDGTINAENVQGDGKRIGDSGPLEMNANVRYPRFENLELGNISLDLPKQESGFRLSGRLKREKFGVFRPELQMKSRIKFDKLKAFLPELNPFSGEFMGEAALSQESETTLALQGNAGFESFGYKTDELKIEGVQGGVPFRQDVRVPKMIPTKSKSESGVFGDDLETQFTKMLRVLMEDAKFVVSSSNILVEPPRTADYEAMRNFYTVDRAQMRIDRIQQAANEISNLSLDASYASGVFQLDRIALQIWEGDLFGDMSMQLSGQDDMRLRMRMTATDLNLDILTAEKVGEQISRGLARKDFLFSGVSDVKLDIGQKVINGTFDVSKLSIPLVIRLVDFQDPDGQDESLQGVKLPLKIGQGLYTLLMGERLSGMKVWIKQNLLNQSFVWDRPWIGEIRPHEIGLDRAFSWLGLDILTEKGIPNPIPIASRALQLISREVSQGKVNLTLADTVQEIRRKNLAEVWANPFWDDLDSKLKPFAGRVVIE
ncbi:MAG: AsmA family protein [Myxococcota bacterium]|nr:AsmA family protein [Myxococcota bacterium]